MKSLKIALVALTLIGFLGTEAKARNRVAEEVIIGTAIGGMVGLILANEMERNSHVAQPVHRQPVVYVPPPPPQHRHDYSSRKHYRHNKRHVQNCREIAVIKEKHGRHGRTFQEKTVKTVCRARR